MLIETLRTYFTASLHWDALKDGSPVELDLHGHSVKAHPLARAGRVVAYGVTASDLRLHRRLRRKIYTKLARRIGTNPLAVFVAAEEESTLIWRWKTAENRSDLPHAAPDETWLAGLVLPLSAPVDPDEVIRRLDAALPPRGLLQPSSGDVSTTPTLVAVLDQASDAVSEAIQDAAALVGPAADDKSRVSFDEVIRLLQSLRAFKHKVIALRDEARALFQEFPVLAQRPTSQTQRPALRQTVKRGERTPQSAYRCPILRALVQLGGKSTARQVLSLVYEEMKDRLSQRDLALVPSGQDLVWRVYAKWQRNEMKLEGLLRGDSPSGIWEITEAGRRYYEEHCQGTAEREAQDKN
ncbi:MAG: winged helix-turn-helix domain-containing protein [Anaerolineae bacterium]|nr:winged helix-turn-helix domain-containing protein [Thermoflexales bacterium]MDW8396668.1 winged helix-turn-helix domain-containing protein [Anaerolineae bacterium]